MNTNKFLIPTIFSLTFVFFLLSCNDEEISSSTSTTTIPDTPNSNILSKENLDSQFPNSYPFPLPPHYPITENFNYYNPNQEEKKDPILTTKDISEIDPEVLSKKIKETGEKIEKLEKESEYHHNEYYDMVKVQKKILSKIKKNKMLMRSSPVGSKEKLEAKKEFENHKKLGKERLKKLREKNNFLNQIINTISNTKNEQLNLKKIQEKLLQNQKKTKNTTDIDKNPSSSTTEEKTTITQQQ
ncbi:hypothetical protein [Blattabacterium cuenoti]|uniref:hypothetical protein n=1 Tax=Blattabacterium cuenoti TaxID=1653831 RepID=UPI00163C5475|nr:hypothetical protein [Blattabacterium cuenoti]